MIDKYVSYLGKMVPSAHFRAFVYSKDSSTQTMLVESHKEFLDAMASGNWVDQPIAETEEAPKKKKKGALDADG